MQVRYSVGWEENGGIEDLMFGKKLFSSILVKEVMQFGIKISINVMEIEFS